MLDAVFQPVNPPRLLRLPRLSSQDVGRSNLLSAARASLSLSLASTPISVSVDAGRDVQDLAWRIEIALNQQPTSFCCSHKLLVRLLTLLEPKLSLDPAPGPHFLALLCDTFIHWVAPVWQQALGWAVEFTGIAAYGPQSGPDVPVVLSIGKDQFRATLAGQATLEQLLARWPITPRPELSLSWSMCLQLGATELPASIVASLRHGDAVIVDPRGGQPALRLAGGWSAAVRVQGQAATLLGPLAPSPDHPRRSSLPVGELKNLETLPVRLEFEVGHRDLSLAEVQKLQPGAVISLGRPASELVEIVVNGRRIGAGELVDVDGVVAVRIKDLFGLG